MYFRIPGEGFHRRAPPVYNVYFQVSTLTDCMVITRSGNPQVGEIFSIFLFNGMNDESEVDTEESQSLRLPRNVFIRMEKNILARYWLINARRSKLIPFMMEFTQRESNDSEEENNNYLSVARVSASAWC